MTSLAGAERAALLALLHRLGPAAPTLCEGWTTHDLAAHLVTRERQPLALPGLVLPALHPLTERLEARARRRPYEDLLRELDAGPPRWSPVGLPAGEDLANLHELFVHHEDVRRLVDPVPRRLPAPLADALWSRLGLLTRPFTRRAPVGVRLQTPDGREHRGRAGTPEVVVRGEPGELFLWAWGRGGVSEVTVDGPADAVAALRAARIGP